MRAWATPGYGRSWQIMCCRSWMLQGLRTCVPHAMPRARSWIMTLLPQSGAQLQAICSQAASSRTSALPQVLPAAVDQPDISLDLSSCSSHRLAHLEQLAALHLHSQEVPLMQDQHSPTTLTRGQQSSPPCSLMPAFNNSCGSREAALPVCECRVPSLPHDAKLNSM